MSEKEVNGVRVDCGGINEEIHPFNNIDDLKGAKYLIVGTFPPHRFVTKKLQKDDVDWFYGSRDNDFWGKEGCGGLFQRALGCENTILKTAKDRKDFCIKKGIAFLDLFQVIKRYENLSSDSNIFPIKIVDLVHYLEKNQDIKAILFTSLWVEQIAKKRILAH